MNLVFWNISLFLPFSVTVSFQFEFLGFLLPFFSLPSSSLYLLYSSIKLFILQEKTQKKSTHLALVSVSGFSFLGCLIVNATHFYFFYSAFHFCTVKAEYRAFKLHRYKVILTSFLMWALIGKMYVFWIRHSCGEEEKD